MDTDKSPKTYKEILKALDDSDFEEFIRRFYSRTGGAFRKNRDYFIKKFLQDNITAENLRKVSRQLPRNELMVIRQMIYYHGKLVVNDFSTGIGKIAANVINRGFAFGVGFKGGKPGVIIPLEICLGIPLDDKTSMPYVLLCAMNKYNSDHIKLMGRHLNIPQYHQLPKIELACLTYRQCIDNYPGAEAKLSKYQSKIMEYIFRQGGVVMEYELYEWAQREGLESRNTDPFISSRYSLRYYLTQAWSRKYDKLGHFDKTLLELILSGLVCIQWADRYDGNSKYFIPAEVQQNFENIYFHKMDAARAEIEKKMYAPAPTKIISYSNRIIDDLLKVQIADRCGFVELTQSGKFKKSALKNIARLLGTDEYYTAYILMFIQSQPSERIIYDTFNFMRSNVIENDLFRAVISLLRSTDGWVNVDLFIDFLFHHRDFYFYGSITDKEDLKYVVYDLTLLGICDASKNFKTIRKNELTDQILDETAEYTVPRMLQKNSKPLLIQPNLEVLVPYNASGELLISLSEFSDITVLDKMVHFTISKMSLLRSMDKGWDEKRILSFLATHSDKQISNGVKTFIDSSLGRRGEAVVMQSAAVIRCSGLGVREKILSIKNLDAVPMEGTEEYVIIKNREAKDVEKLLKSKGIFAEFSE